MHERAYPLTFFEGTEGQVTQIHYQELYQEAADAFGLTVFYVPMDDPDSDNIDGILQEVKNRTYEKIYGMRMAVSDPATLAMNPTFGKFGMILDDSIELYITLKEFRERILGYNYSQTDYLDGTEVQDYTTIVPPPKKGDLIYNIQPWNSLFIITEVQNKDFALTEGFTFYHLVCKKYTARQDTTITLAPVMTGGDSGPVEIGGLDIMPAVDVLNEINKTEDAQTQKSTDPSVIDATGFTPDNTNVNINQTAAFEAKDLRADDSDIFADF